jgi:hypothetical protein
LIIKPEETRCDIAGAVTLTARPVVVYQLSKTLSGKTNLPRIRSRMERQPSMRLKGGFSGNITPLFQYVMSLEPGTRPPDTPFPATRVLELKAHIMCAAGPVGVVAHTRDSKLLLEAKSTVKANLNVSMRLDIFEAKNPTVLGISLACTTIEPLYGAYVVGTLISDIPLKLNIRAHAKVGAILTGPGGILTKIGPQSKRKLRWRIDEYKTDTPPTKKYIRRLVVSDRNGCGCQFVHLGIYDLRSGIWEVGTERQVMLVLPQMSALGPHYPPDIYPQYTEDGNYRVVTVMNKMYDLYPPTSFVATEIRGRKQIASPKSITELPRFIFVYEGCNGSFFMINAECE